MALIAWNDSYSVKVKQFDDQHKKLVEMLNELHDAMKVGKGKEVLGKVLDRLIQYTATHFAEEEKIMKLHNYNDYERHKIEHNKLVAQVLDVQKQFNSGNATLTTAVLSFLKDWLQKHIQGEDMKYGVFLNGKGIS